MVKKLMRRLYFILSVCTLIPFAITGQTSLEKINLEHGTYQVGFKHFTLIDSTRTYKRILEWTNKHMYRPIPTSIWYPAQPTNKQANTSMTVLDYLEVLKKEEEWEHLPNEQILNWFDYLHNNEQNRAHLPEKTNAFYNANAAKGNFPVLIYAASYQASSMENFALCEYLASHGYMVIASPSRGSDTRILSGGTTKDMSTQAQDIEFLIKTAASIPHANTDKMATIGFSFGGISDVLAQMKNENIKAMVSLDGSIRYQYDKIKSAPYFDMNKVDVPFLHMAQKDIPQEVLQEDNIHPDLNTKFEFYDKLEYSRAYRLKFNLLSHSYFSTFGVLFQKRDPRQDKSDYEIMNSYKLVALYTLNFLNAFLQEDLTALQFMENQPSENKIEQGLIRYTSKKPHKKAFRLQDFHELAIQQQYKNLSALYQNMLQKHPNFRLPEWQLNKLGLYLQYNPEKLPYAIQVFLLAVDIYPQSANLYDSLAEAYLLQKDEKNAILNFKKSLELNPENQNAVDRLKQLNNK